VIQKFGGASGADPSPLKNSEVELSNGTIVCCATKVTLCRTSIPCSFFNKATAG
jgi:hypothetical protein